MLLNRPSEGGLTLYCIIVWIQQGYNQFLGRQGSKPFNKWRNLPTNQKWEVSMVCLWQLIVLVMWNIFKSILTPLRKLLHADVKSILSDEQQHAFQSIKGVASGKAGGNRSPIHADLLLRNHASVKDKWLHSNSLSDLCMYTLRRLICFCLRA